MNKIKKDDLVVVIAGKDKDKQGKVISVDTKNDLERVTKIIQSRMENRTEK